MPGTRRVRHTTQSMKGTPPWSSGLPSTASGPGRLTVTAYQGPVPRRKGDDGHPSLSRARLRGGQQSRRASRQRARPVAAGALRPEATPVLAPRRRDRGAVHVGGRPGRRRQDIPPGRLDGREHGGHGVDVARRGGSGRRPVLGRLHQGHRRRGARVRLVADRPVAASVGPSRAGRRPARGPRRRRRAHVGRDRRPAPRRRRRGAGTGSAGPAPAGVAAHHRLDPPRSAHAARAAPGPQPARRGPLHRAAVLARGGLRAAQPAGAVATTGADRGRSRAGRRVGRQPAAGGAGRAVGAGATRFGHPADHRGRPRPGVRVARGPGGRGPRA